MIAIASDHTGLELKKQVIGLLEKQGLTWRDFGTYTAESCHYPEYALPAAQAVAAGECDRGILICGTGLGMMLAANKVHGVRCALLSDCYSAEMSRRHNDANMMAVGARVLGSELALRIVDIWLNTPFDGGRHKTRVDQIMRIEAFQSLTDPAGE